MITNQAAPPTHQTLATPAPIQRHFPKPMNTPQQSLLAHQEAQQMSVLCTAPGKMHAKHSRHSRGALALLPPLMFCTSYLLPPHQQRQSTPLLLLAGSSLSCTKPHSGSSNTTQSLWFSEVTGT